MGFNFSENSFTVSAATEKFLCDRLLDQNQPISERFRALFSLRNLRGPRPRSALIAATRENSNLLAHEAAFALGQMQDSDAVPALEAVLNDLSLHPIVRHEAAEALGAIGSETNVPLLKKSLTSDPAQEVRETCELALGRIEEQKKVQNCDGESMVESSPFLSIDPAAPASCSSIDELRQVLLDEEKSMYQRYSALFALRNHGGDKSITAIIDSLGAKSALLRHEEDKNVAHLTHVSEMEKKIETLARITTILKDVIHNKDRIIARLQQPYSLDCIPVEAEFQKQFSELLMKAGSDYGALTASVADFQWSQNFKEPPTVWGEMLRPIPVALASCTRFFEAMSAMRESFATLQTLRVGHSSSSLKTTPAIDSSQRTLGDSECVTPPPWRNESSFDDLALRSFSGQEANDGNSEVGDTNQVDGASLRRLSWPPVKKNGL